jgi:hypothetical protein
MNRYLFERIRRLWTIGAFVVAWLLMVSLCAMVCAQEPATGAVEDAVQPQKAVDAIKQEVGPA